MRPQGTELNLEDVEELCRQMVQEARDRVTDLRAEQRALEEEVRARRQAEEQDAAERRGAIEAEIEEERKKALEEVESEKQAIIESGRQSGFEVGQREGFDAGYAEGRQKGYTEGREAEIARIADEATPAIDAIRSAIDQLSADRTELLHGARSEVLRLAVEIARRVIRREVRDCHGEVVVKLIEQAVELIFLRERIVIQVNEADLKAVEKYAAEALESLAGVEELEVRPARDVARGGCRILAGTGVVDLDLDVQLQEIERALLGEYAPERLPEETVETVEEEVPS